ncbi:SUF system NifU family Fe-S cluster assembly protein [Roseococcus sp. SYP-B2431]|uniref:Fe-S cluster assembly sulfur transfer protein SufU n=1 Tax=Roseococcus sp. SYP-B2431 TaxID=2496640 RepID=UPI001039E5ED|nr:SUF system NifU family Fe-S cluster assembly protein [Roseococcus sp. SYP-B2431]TCI00337.1 SUF system NifU family Fe-S cluster assembly protein [Roseococcus sp. SYP-B2431]
MNDAGDIADLYSKTLRELARDPAHKGRPEAFDATARGDNPMCGDRVDIYVSLEGDRIREARHVARGCEICQASASLLAGLVPGKTRAESSALGQRAGEIAKSGIGDDGSEELRRLSLFTVVHKFPSRVKCVTLAWNALDAALSGVKETSSE